MPPGLILFLVTAIWGSSFVVSKHVVRAISPTPYLAMRYLIATVLLVAIFGRVIWRERGNRVLYRDGLLLGGLNAIALCFQLVGQLYTTASKSAFITSLYMPLVPLFGALFYRTRSTERQLVGVAVATTGLALLTYPTGSAAWNPGDLLTIVSAILYAITIIETSQRSKNHSSKVLTTAQVLVSALAFSLLHGLVVAFDVRFTAPTATPVNGFVIAGVLYMAVICTVLTFLMQNWALSRMHVTYATIIFSLEAPVATAIGLLADGVEEWPGPRGAIGAGLMLIAVGLSRRST